LNAHSQPTSWVCDVIPARDHVRVAPSGELARSTAPRLDQTVRELREVGFQRVILDLRHLCFIDAGGLRLILELDAIARADSVEIELIAGPPEVQRVFELAGVVNRLPFSDLHRSSPAPTINHRASPAPADRDLVPARRAQGIDGVAPG
jgi:anti-sigma B factor antagonist